MAERKLALPLNVRGELDTAMPVSDRPFGTLVEALDTSPQAWGPRRGSNAFTRCWESPGVSSLYDYIFLAGVATYGSFISRELSYLQLGTQFTLDLFMIYDGDSTATGKDEVGLYSFVVQNGSVQILIYGPNHAKARKLKVEITTTNAAGTADSMVTFDTSTAIPMGSAQTDKIHLRLVRDGTTATMYLNGTSDGSTTGLSATHGLTGESGWLRLGYMTTLDDTSITFNGRIFAAILRDGAFATTPIEAVMPCNPMGLNVHHYILGRNFALGGSDRFFDASRFGFHPRIVGAAYSVTSSNDSTAPAPSNVQGLTTWTTRKNRTATSVMCGGTLSTAVA